MKYTEALQMRKWAALPRPGLYAAGGSLLGASLGALDAWRKGRSIWRGAAKGGVNGGLAGAGAGLWQDNRNLRATNATWRGINDTLENENSDLHFDNMNLQRKLNEAETRLDNLPVSTLTPKQVRTVKDLMYGEHEILSKLLYGVPGSVMQQADSKED